MTLVVTLLTLGTCEEDMVSTIFSLRVLQPDPHRSGSPGAPIVTKKEIVRTISEEIGLTQLKTKEIVQKTFDAIVETLVTEGRIELRNFGVFEVKKRAARRARNPRTGEKVDVAEKYVVTFKPGKEMEKRVGDMTEAPGTASNDAADNNGTPNVTPASPSPTLPDSPTPGPSDSTNN